MSNYKPLPSPDELNDLFEYSEGQLIRKTSAGPRKKGSVAGRPNHDGYTVVTINGKEYMAHRIIWKIHTGEDPSVLEIDHINRDRKDNRIENLRAVTRQENQKNRVQAKVMRKNITGKLYIKYRAYKKTNQWEVSVRGTYLGTFSTYEEALSVRNHYLTINPILTKTNG